jgi:uncharacterized damage-inducible protein DinB
MSLADLLLPEFDTEMATTRRVLARVPDDAGRGEWRPHAKSFPLAHLAQLVARMPGWVTMHIRQSELDLAPPGGGSFPGYTIESTATLLSELDRNAAEARTALAETSDDAFAETWSLKMAGRTLQADTRYQMLRQTLNHLVHHRAQLGVYLRLVDVPVPSMYGPTADEKWG